jgi:hypothetical protein
VMVSDKAKAMDTFTINVNGAEVKPSNSLECRGSPSTGSSRCVRTCTPWRGRQGSVQAAWHASLNTFNVGNCCGSLGVVC